MTRLDWSAGRWTHEPARVELDGDALLVTAREGSDAWRTTAYGFVHDDEHALVAPFEPGTAVEVAFTGDFSGDFDQAGLFLRADDETWIKAGVEFSDGLLQLGAVVTRGVSDWSVAPVPHGAGRRITVRASRSSDAVAIRARIGDEPFALIRLAPLDPDAAVEAGPFVCAPSRAGLTARFESWTVTDADASLH
jgi:regulation of enolase protein 1 (concanavalin A-like superfamily)